MHRTSDFILFLSEEKIATEALVKRIGEDIKEDSFIFIFKPQ